MENSSLHMKSKSVWDCGQAIDEFYKSRLREGFEERFRTEYYGSFVAENKMKDNVESFEKNDRSVSHSKLVEDIFDSITIYLHITTDPEIIGDTRHSRLTFSDVPFSEPNWKDRQHHISLGRDIPVVVDANIHEKKCYNVHRKLMFDMAYILTMKGHEVYVCDSRDPSEKVGSYTHISDSIKERLFQLKEKETLDAGRNS